MKPIVEEFDFLNVRCFIRQRNSIFNVKCIFYRNDTNEEYAVESMNYDSYESAENYARTLFHKYKNDRPTDWLQRGHAELVSQYKAKKGVLDTERNNLMTRAYKIGIDGDISLHIKKIHSELIELFKKTNLLSENEMKKLFSEEEINFDDIDGYSARIKIYDMILNPSAEVQMAHSNYIKKWNSYEP